MQTNENTQPVYVIRGELKPNSIYRLDERVDTERGCTWIERITFVEGDVCYTEDYVLVENLHLKSLIDQQIVMKEY